MFIVLKGDIGWLSQEEKTDLLLVLFRIHSQKIYVLYFALRGSSYSYWVLFLIKPSLHSSDDTVRIWFAVQVLIGL